MGASSPSLSAASVVRELQIVAKRFGIRVEEFFVDFDKHRARKLSAEHFRMGLRAAFEGRLTLTEGQVQALLSEYAVTGAEAKGVPVALTPVRWRDFTEAINAAFTTADLETQPLSTPYFDEAGWELQQLPAEQMALVEALLLRFEKQVRMRSLSLHPMMRDFEKNSRSPKMADRVTRTQLRQALSVSDLQHTNAEFEALAARFDTRKDGSVDYVAFINVLEPQEGYNQRKSTGTLHSTGGFHHPHSTSALSTHQPGRPPASLDQPRLLEKPSTDVAELVARMRRRCQQLRLRVEDAFRDGDRLNSGAVTVEQFRSGIACAFDTSGLALTEAEFGFLVQAYRRTPASGAGVAPGVLLVNWRPFCADVDPVVTGLEQNPLAVVTPVAIDRSLKQLAPEREAALAVVIANIRHRFITRRVLLKPFFLDFAQSRIKATTADHVTRKQFRQALSTAGIELPAAQLELVYEKFDDSNDLSINYVAFTRAVDPQETYSDRPSEPRNLFTDGYIKVRVMLQPAQSAF